LKDGTHSVYVDPTASVAAPELLGRGIAIDQYVVMGRVSVGDGTVIKPGCAIATGSSIGRDCVLHPRVTIYPGVTLGDRVVVHAGAVLGADGFGYVRDPATGEYIQFPQQGTLIVEDDVEIGANTTIDRGALEETRIGKGTKIDNLVHIGHNVRVGRNVVIAAQTGISGSTVIGDGAVIGGQVGMGDHATVGQGVIVGSGAGILPHKKLHGPGQVFWGVPAKPLHQHLKELATIAKLAKAPTASQSEPRQGRPYPEEGK
jgi:UDP-3-O-[3-hydroxymyristoyl] glucosamine N-acyltransferase